MNAIIHEGKVYDLAEWVLISEYVRRHKLKYNAVVWRMIDKGIVPADCWVEFPHLNDLRLIKDQVYEKL